MQKTHDDHGNWNIILTQVDTSIHKRRHMGGVGSQRGVVLAQWGAQGRPKLARGARMWNALLPFILLETRVGTSWIFGSQNILCKVAVKPFVREPEYRLCYHRCCKGRNYHGIKCSKYIKGLIINWKMRLRRSLIYLNILEFLPPGSFRVYSTCIWL